MLLFFVPRLIPLDTGQRIGVPVHKCAFARAVRAGDHPWTRPALAQSRTLSISWPALAASSGSFFHNSSKKFSVCSTGTTYDSLIRFE